MRVSRKKPPAENGTYDDDRSGMDLGASMLGGTHRAAQVEGDHG
jgi:hypothetical protein